MTTREAQLEILRRYMPDVDAPLYPTAPTATRAPSQNQNHALVRAVVRGIGGPLKEEFDKLRRENETLKAQNLQLRTEWRADLAELRADVMQYKADLSAHERQLAEVIERYGLPSESLAAAPRRLS